MSVSSRALSFSIYEDEDCRVSRLFVNPYVGVSQTGPATHMPPSPFPPPRGDTDNGGNNNNNNNSSSSRSNNRPFTVRVPLSGPSSTTSAGLTTPIAPHHLANEGPFVVGVPSTASSSTAVFHTTRWDDTPSLGSDDLGTGPPHFSMCSLLQSLPQQQPTQVDTPKSVRDERPCVTRGVWKNFGPDDIEIDDVHDDQGGEDEDDDTVVVDDVDDGYTQQLSISPQKSWAWEAYNPETLAFDAMEESGDGVQEQRRQEQLYKPTGEMDVFAGGNHGSTQSEPQRVPQIHGHPRILRLSRLGSTRDMVTSSTSSCLANPTYPSGSSSSVSPSRQMAERGSGRRQRQRRRRRTEVERTMYHAIMWSGMGDVVPNVSVVTGEPLVRMPLPWTFGGGPSGKPKDEGGDFAVCLSRDLVREVEKRWAERCKKIKKHG